MKYMVITIKHHDGFALYKSPVSDFDIESTPYDGDLIKELYDACQEEGIAFGVYYSQVPYKKVSLWLKRIISIINLEVCKY